MPTIKDVAQKANVSTATVSRVLNNHKWVDPATAARVKEVIRSMNYVPSALARRVRERKTDIVGILMDTQSVPVYHDLFFTEIIRGVGSVLEPSGKHILVYSGALGSKARTAFDAITGRLIEGIIVGGIAVRIERALIEALKHASPNVVVIGQHLKELEVPRVLIDNWQGGYTVGRELVKRGVKSIAIITPAAAAYAFRDRVVGIKAALEKFGGEEVKLKIHKVDGMKPQDGYDGLRTLLRAAPHVQGIVITHSALTIGAIRYAQETGLTIPDDVLLIGDGPSHVIELYPHSCAFIHTNAHRVGELAASQVLGTPLNQRDQRWTLKVPRQLYIPKSWNGGQPGDSEQEEVRNPGAQNN